ncbi:unnamed protein product [Rhizoctonia solani]|uniref:AAA+ ATPase domain-containing protein n=1 Tax=Rhizoctonia solani TaxID=456999 RepID=A0A8H3E1Y9_9AGAM|nr:unnamed protein product [Rhizoctonia solani]
MSSAPNVGHSNLPPDSLIGDAHTRLSLIFQSYASPRMNEAKCRNDANDPSLLLYCPIEGGEGVIDATVKELALRTCASVKTIDILQLIREQPRSFWNDPPASGPEDGDPPSRSESGEECGYLKMSHAVPATKIAQLVDSMIQRNDVPEGEGNPVPPRRIIYIRDFGFLATFAPACYKKIIASVRREQMDNGETNVPTAVILGSSPLLIGGSLFQKEDSYQRSAYRSDPSSARSMHSWGEGQDAQRYRDQRLDGQHRMWKKDTLADHIYKHLGYTNVLTEYDQGKPLDSKRLPTCVVVPVKRNPKMERLARENRRSELNRLGVYIALLVAGGELDTEKQLSNLDDESDPFTELCKAKLIEYKYLKRVADRVITTLLALSSDPKPPAPATISWDEYCAAWKDQEDRDLERDSWLQTSVLSEDPEPSEVNQDVPDGSNSSSHRDDNHSKEDKPEEKPDPTELLVEQIKRSGDQYQRQLLNCLIGPADIRTGFDSVHLPEATIDAIRTLVSLPLVCPEAFNTGILKQYGMSGALLFGPPGTGKTHLAKAIAKESGARMITIKPSDILDKYVGGNEKKIDALFKVARQFKPCIIFIDEVDALFGARMSAKDNWSRWRNDMLTQFAQEMDGMRSSDVIVIGATNRPFDLDDAIIRRLPCRVLVDLPNKVAREAILEILLKEEELESDVTLADLAGLTSRFSGSDLKHLCVAAAFESAKEVAKVSWVQKKGESSGSMSSTSGISTPKAPESGTDGPPNLDPIESADKPSPTPMEDDTTPTEPVSQVRKLAKKHFTQALKQVRASTAETQSSLVELRRWNSQFGSSNQSSSAAEYGTPGLGLPGSNRPWMNGSGAGTLGVHSPGMYASGMSGMNDSMANSNKPGMGPGGSGSGSGTSGGSSHGLNVAPPVEGSYLRSLGVGI